MEQDRVVIETPEHVQFSYELAGLGSRFLALAIDILIQAAGITVLVVLIVALGPALTWIRSEWGEVAGIPVTALVVLMFIELLRLAYFIVFELVWTGQTPGKRMAGLRVIRAAGGSVGFAASAIRNILRIIDRLPVFYLLGGAFAFFTTAIQRIGDLAAGTIVVKERLWEYPGEGQEVAQHQQSWAAAVRRVKGYVRSLSSEQIATVSRFVERRDELADDVRRQLAERIVASFRQQLPADLFGKEADSERLLEIVYQAHLERERNL